MSDLKTRLGEVMRSARWEYQDLVRESGESHSVVSQWLGRGSKEIKTIGKMEAAIRLERATGFSALWIAKGIGPKRTTSQETPTLKSAIVVSPAISIPTYKVPPTIRWEDLMLAADTLPGEFFVLLQDDAMAPKAGKGAKVQFDRGRQPEPGDALLVRDRAGRVHFREYRLKRAGGWEAFAYNPAYPTLDSELDGLEVIAVFSGISVGWAQLMR
jgi:hypothetical protein